MAKDKWIKDITIFQKQCYEEPVILPGPSDLVKKKLQAIENEVYEDKIEKLKEKNQEIKEEAGEKNEENAAADAIKVIFYFL